MRRKQITASKAAQAPVPGSWIESASGFDRPPYDLLQNRRFRSNVISRPMAALELETRVPSFHKVRHVA